jgi:multidrug efflux pump subunit AcrB
MFKAVPGGFIPTQDKLYLIGGVKMPEGSSLARTDAVIRKMSEIGMNTEGVDYAVAFPGLNALQFTNTPNTGTVFFGLKPFDQRKHSAAEINAEINAKIAQIQQGFGFSILPPPILGLGQGSGYSLYIQDRGGLAMARCKRGEYPVRGDYADAGNALPDLNLPGKRAAAGCAGRSRQGESAGRVADRSVRYAANLSGLVLCE